MRLNKLFIVLLLLPAFASAEEDKKAKSNVAKELAVCAGYFFIGSEAAKKSGDEALASSIKTTADAALVTSIKLSDKKTATNSLQIAMKDHQRIINNNTANIGVLIRKYKTLCKEIMTSPKKRYEYWVKKK